MAKVTITKDSRKKADVILNNTNGTIEFSKDVIVRVDGDDDSPCKAAKLILAKIKAGSDAN